MKSFLDLNPPTLPQFLLSHSTVAQAWGAQTQCQRLAFPKVRGSLWSPGNQQTIPGCRTARCVYDAALTQPCSRSRGRGFLFGRPALAVTGPCAEHTSGADAINRRVTRWCLLRYGLSHCSAGRTPPQPATPRAGYRRASFSQKSANTLILSFLLSEITAHNHMH